MIFDKEIKWFCVQIDVSQIPRAESLYFEISTKSISFKVNNYPLNLMGKIEVMTEEQSWTHLRKTSILQIIKG